MANTLEIIIKVTDNASKTIKLVNEELKGTGDAARDANSKTKTFGSGLDNLKSSFLKTVGVVGAFSGAIVAAGVAFNTAFEWGKQGAAILQTEQSFQLLLDQWQIAPGYLDKLRDASLGTVDDMTLMSSTLTLVAGTSKELGKEMLTVAPRILEIAKAANKLNPTLGDTAFLYQSLMTGIKRGSPLLIDNTGLTLKLGKANEDMAKSLGKSVEELTDTEKQMALLNATLEAGEGLIAQVGGNVASSADEFARLDAQLKNNVATLKTQLTPAFIEALTWLNEYIKKRNDYVEAVNAVKAAYDEEMISLSEYNKMVVLSYTSDNAGIEIKKALADTLMVESKAFVMAAAEGGMLINTTKDLTKATVDVKKGYEQAIPIIGVYTGSMSAANAQTDALKSSTISASDAMKEYSVQLLYNKAAANMDAQAAMLLARELGLVDERTVDAYAAIDTLTKKYDTNRDGAIDAREATSGYVSAVKALNQQIRALPESKTVNIFVNTYGKTPNIQGGQISFGKQAGGAVAGGGAYMVGEMGPEMFVPYQSGYIVPNQNVSNVTNNWSLTINEAGRRGNVREDFALLKALAE